MNVDDIVEIGKSWGWTGTPGSIPADVLNHGTVNVDDFVEIGKHWGQQANPSTARQSIAVAPTSAPSQTSTATLTASPTVTPTPTATMVPVRVMSATNALNGPAFQPLVSSTPNVSVSWNPVNSPNPPAGNNHAIGDVFNMAVVVSTDVGIRGWQLNFTWNPAVVNVLDYQIIQTSSVNGDCLTSSTSPPCPFGDSFLDDFARAQTPRMGHQVSDAFIDNSVGSFSAPVSDALTGQGSLAGPKGSGNLMVVKFQAVGNGASALTFDPNPNTGTLVATLSQTIPAKVTSGAVFVGPVSQPNLVVQSPAVSAVAGSPTSFNVAFTVANTGNAASKAVTNGITVTASNATPASTQANISAMPAGTIQTFSAGPFTLASGQTDSAITITLSCGTQFPCATGPAATLTYSTNATVTPTVTATATTTSTPTQTATVTITPTLEVNTVTPTPTPTVNGGSLTLVKPTAAFGVGSTFTVEVHVSPNDTSSSVRGAQFGMTYDPALVQVNKIQAGTFLNDWAATQPAPKPKASVNPPFDFTTKAGVVGAGSITLQGGTGGPTGAGQLAVITLKALAQGQVTLKLTDADISFFDPNNKVVGERTVPASDGSLDLTIGPPVATATATSTSTGTPTATSAVTATASPTPSPTPSVTLTPTVTPTATLDPTQAANATATANVATVTAQLTLGTAVPTVNTATAVATSTPPTANISLSFSPTAVSLQVGDTATINAVINADRALGGAQFGFTFDKNIIQIQSVDPGTFFSDWTSRNSVPDPIQVGSWDIDNNAGTVAIGSFALVGSHQSGPSGSGTMAIIKLKAIANGNAAINYTAASSTGTLVQGFNSLGANIDLAGLQLTPASIQVGGPTPTATATPAGGSGTAQPTATLGSGSSVFAGAGTPGAVSPGSALSAIAGAPGSGGAQTGGAQSGGVAQTGGGIGTVPGASGTTAGGSRTTGAQAASSGPTGSNGATANGTPANAAAGANRVGVAGQPGATGPFVGNDNGTGGLAPEAVATAAALGTVLVPGGPQVAGAVVGRNSSGQLVPAGSVGSQNLALVATVDVGARVDERGVTQGFFDYKDPSGLFSFVIPSGTRMLTRERAPLRAIDVYLVLDRPVVPDEQELVSTPLEFGPSGATFDPPILISAAYERGALPQGLHDDDLALAVLDTTSGNWSLLPGTIDPANSRVTGEAAHFSSFAVITKPPAGVNWLATAGILLTEIGLGIGGYVLLRRRFASQAAVPWAGNADVAGETRIDLTATAPEDAKSIWVPEALPAPAPDHISDSLHPHDPTGMSDTSERSSRPE